MDVCDWILFHLLFYTWDVWLELRSWHYPYLCCLLPVYNIKRIIYYWTNSLQASGNDRSYTATFFSFTVLANPEALTPLPRRALFVSFLDQMSSDDVKTSHSDRHTTPWCHTVTTWRHMTSYVIPKRYVRLCLFVFFFCFFFWIFLFWPILRRVNYHIIWNLLIFMMLRFPSMPGFLM